MKIKIEQTGLNDSEKLEEENKITGYEKQIKEVKNRLEEEQREKQKNKERLDGIKEKKLRKKLSEKYQLDFIEDFFEDVAIGRKDKKWYFFDKKGKEIKELISKDFDAVTGFEGGTCYIKKNGEWYFVDKEGRRISDDENGNQAPSV